jgi:S1-C subfamily serine protease
VRRPNGPGAFKLEILSDGKTIRPTNPNQGSHFQPGGTTHMWRLMLVLMFLVAAAAGYFTGLTTAQTKLVTPDEINTVEIVGRSRRAVVTVFAKIAPEARQPGEPEDVISSGFFYKSNLIVTNYHAIADNPVAVSVQLFDGRRVPATIEAIDQGIDIALLKVSGVTAPTTLKFSNSQDVTPGQKLITLGSPSGKPNSVAVGVASSYNRITEFNDDIGVEIPEMLLMDVNIQLGNSGGPVLDSRGNVVSVVDANLTNAVASGGVIGLAIPSNLVSESLSDLEKFGVSQRGQLGANLKDLTELEPITLKLAGFTSSNGAMVVEIEPGGPAAKAGVRAASLNRDGKLETLGDIVIKVDSVAVRNKFDVVQEVAKRRPGQGVTLTVWRNKQPVQLKVQITARTR